MNLGLATNGFQCVGGTSLSLATAGYQCPMATLPPFVVIDITDPDVCGGLRLSADDPRLAVFYNGELMRRGVDYREGPGLSQISLFRVVGPADTVVVRRL